MMHDQSTHVNKKDHYFQSRDFDLAAKVAKLPDSALVGAFEVAALTGIAATSIQKPSQRRSIAFPAPRVVGRMNKWPLGLVRHWLSQGAAAAPATPVLSGRGRPTKAAQIARHLAAAQEAK